jgi:hypothetical protein
MNAFSNDVDLLRYEPAVFKGLTFAGQTLCRGNNGQVSGATFLASGENFITKQVRPGHVICLSDGVGNIDGVYEVVSVDAAAQLTISVLRADPSGPPIPVGSGTNLFYRVGTFDAQAAEAAETLTQMLAVRPGRPDSPCSAEDIVDAGPLRPLSALMILQRIYSGLYQNEETDGVYLTKRDQYEQLARQAAGRCVIQIDAGADGVCEKTLTGDSTKLIRE